MSALGSGNTEKYIEQMINKIGINNGSSVSKLENQHIYLPKFMLDALWELYDVTEEEKYLEASKAFIDVYIDDQGRWNEDYLSKFSLNPFDIGQGLCRLYEVTGEEKYKKSIEYLYKELQKQIEGSKLMFSMPFRDLHACMTFYMTYETKFNRMNKYIDIYRAFVELDMQMQEEATELYRYFIKEEKGTNLAQIDNRGVNLPEKCSLNTLVWYAVLLLDSLEEMDEQIFYEYRRIMDMFKGVISYLLPVQESMSEELDFNFNNRVEVMKLIGIREKMLFAYAIVKGVRLGYLPKRYRGYGEYIVEHTYHTYLGPNEINLSKLNDDWDLELFIALRLELEYDLLSMR